MDEKKIAARIASEGDSAIVPMLVSLHQGRYLMDICLRNHSDRLHGPWRDSLVDHWYEHAEEQRSMAYDLAMKLVAMGIDPSLTDIKIPASDNDLNSMILDLSSRLRSLLAMGESILNTSPSSAIRIMIENHIVTDNQHLDDIIRMTP